LTFSPDVQLIWHPNGTQSDDMVFVYGIRGQVDL
jgi:carbohydrate-selective porin OprB